MGHSLTASGRGMSHGVGAACRVAGKLPVPPPPRTASRGGRRPRDRSAPERRGNGLRRRLTKSPAPHARGHCPQPTPAPPTGFGGRTFTADPRSLHPSSLLPVRGEALAGAAGPTSGIPFDPASFFSSSYIAPGLDSSQGSPLSRTRTRLPTSSS